MKISTKGRYGLRVMLELAMRSGNGPVMMSTLAACQGISRKYLHSLLTSLKAVGLVRSIRGAGGGYVLAQPASGISVGQIVEALEGAIAPVDCVRDEAICDRSESCAARDVWSDLGAAMSTVLNQTNLAELAASQKEKQSVISMYHI